MAVTIRNFSCVPLALLAVSLMSGCASQQPVTAEPVAVSQDVVWPAPPEPPRIRYVGSLSSEEDLTGKRKRSVADMLLGEEEQQTIGALIKPYGVHSDGKGRVFVADSGIAGLPVFDTGRKQLEVWGTSGPGRLRKIIGVTSDADGNVYVSDVIDKRIVVFDRSGDFVRAFGGEGVLERPSGIVFSDSQGLLYVTDSKLHQVLVFDTEGTLRSTIGERGTEAGQFNFPTNIAVDGEGRLYVADTLNFRVQIFESDGRFVSMFGEIGDRRGYFNRLKGIGVDTAGHIYAVDASFNNFQIFNPDGQLLLVVGEGGHGGPGGFYLPAGAHVDRNNRIHVADQYNRRIQVFEYIGDSVEAGAEPDGS